MHADSHIFYLKGPGADLVVPHLMLTSKECVVFKSYYMFLGNEAHANLLHTVGLHKRHKSFVQFQSCDSYFWKSISLRVGK